MRAWVLWMVVSMVVSACATSGGRDGRQNADPLAPRAVVDLSQALDEKTDAKLVAENVTKPIYFGFDTVSLFNHAGTHYDPPRHVLEAGAAADAVPVHRLVGRARVVDLRDRKDGAALSRTDFEGVVHPGDFVIAFVGCSARKVCPYVGKDAAEYLTAMSIRAFGTDMWTLSDSQRFAAFKAAGARGESSAPEDWAPEHVELLSKGVPVFEGLTNLEPLLSEPQVLIVALPLKLVGASGAPARVVALVF